MGRTFYLASCEHKWQLTIDNKIVRASKQQDVREMWIQQLLFLWSIRTQVLGISAYMNPACALIFGACLYYHDIEEKCCNFIVFSPFSASQRLRQEIHLTL